MYYITSYNDDQVVEQSSCKSSSLAKSKFASAIKSAGAHCVNRVTVENQSFGRNRILEDWCETSGQRSTVPQPRHPYSVVTVSEDSRCRATFADEDNARRTFAHNKEHAKRAHSKVTSIILAQKERVDATRLGRARVKITVLEEWERPTLVDQIEAGYCYKIHGFETALDPDRSAKTAKWYKTRDKAIKAAQQMARGSSDVLVVYKAAIIVDCDGETYVE